MKIAHITTVDMSLRYLLLNQLRSLQQSGYEVVGIDCSVPIKAGGAIHCLTHEIPAIPSPNRVRPILPEGVITTRRPVFRWERPEGIESQYLVLREGTETEHTPVVFSGFLAEDTR